VNGTCKEIKAELDQLRDRFNTIATVCNSARQIDLTAVYTGLRPHTDKWFRSDGKLRDNPFARGCIPIRAYRAKIPISWADGDRREVHIKFPDHDMRDKLGASIREVIDAVVGEASAMFDYTDGDETIYWYFHAPDAECDRLANEVVSRLLSMIFTP
jgi:hypothetical protein